MSKLKNAEKQRSLKKQENTDISFEEKLGSKAKLIIAHAVIILLVVIFFAPLYFGDKTVVSGDIFNIHSYTNYFASDSNFLWDPYIFLGMPMFGNVGWFDFFFHAVDIIRLNLSNLFASEYTGWTLYFFLLGFFYYYLMRDLKATFMVSIIVAVAAVFSTGILLLFLIGHITKLLSLMMFPLVILFLLRISKEIRLIDVLLFTLTLHSLFRQWHVQIMFYIFFTVGIYYLYFFIRGFYEKDKLLLKNLAWSVIVFILIFLAAGGMNYYKLKQIYDYSEYSTRGTKSIVDIENKAEQKTDEEFYQYATNWSFSPGEVMTFIIPSYYGFGNVTYKGPLTDNQEVETNTYFGQMPFVDTAQYFGVVIFFLGLLGIFLRWREPLVQFLAILIFISLLISFGRTFPILYDPFFHYVPFFDKFRAPSMILNLIQLSFPILAGLGIMKIISFRNKKSVKGEKILKFTAFGVSGLFVLALIFNRALASGFESRIAEVPQRGEQLKPLYDFMSTMFINDVFISLGLLAVVSWLAYSYVSGKVSINLLTTAILVMVIFDLWRIDYRGARFEDTSVVEERFAMPDYVKVIKSEENEDPYRLLNLKQDRSPGSFNNNNNIHVYFLEEDFYGYSGIKPRSYQDIIDVIGPVNQTLWNMLNVKYIITEQQVAMPGLNPVYSAEKTFIYENEAALPRAYFIDNLEYAEPMEILNRIKNNSFDPSNTAFTNVKDIAQIEAPGEDAFVRITDYTNEKISLDVNSTGNNLLFFGATYYPIGWKASAGDQELEIIRLNHGFMGAVIPEGKHRVEFSFEPSTFYAGRYITLTFNLIILIGLIFHIYRVKKTK